MKYLLDTHTWIWWHTRPAALSKKVREVLEASERYEELLLSAISPWEFAKLVEVGRLRINYDGEEWIREALLMDKLRLVPLSPEISWRSTTLPRPFHNDPADQLIVATARLENATILTKDRLIQDYEHVRSLW